MSENTPETAAMLELIETRGTNLQLPASEAMVAAAEARFGIAFPPSYRAALLRHNWFTIGTNAFLSIPSVSNSCNDDVVGMTEQCREMSDSRIESGYAGASGVADADLLRGSVCIDDSGGSGDCFWLLCGLADAGSECPVGRHDHEQDWIFVIDASSLERLVWFLLGGAD